MSDNSNNNGNRKITTILVTHAAHELGLTQEQFRILLKPFYKNWETVKRIKYHFFTTIAEAMLERAQELDSEKQEKTSEQEAQPENKPQADESEQFNDDGGTTSSLALPEESEEIEVSPQKAKQHLRMQLTSNLPQQALKLNQLTKVTAVALSQENLKDFEQIYVHRMNNGMNKIISNQTAVTMGAIDKLQEADNAEFLGDVGKCQSLELQDLDAGMNLLLKKIK